MNVRDHPVFSESKSISDLSQIMIETKKAVIYSLVYHLLKLSLILPVATIIVERFFGHENYLKYYIKNKISYGCKNKL